jgi:hypothetical protein
VLELTSPRFSPGCPPKDRGTARGAVVAVVNQDMKTVLAAAGRFLAYCLLAALPVLLLRHDLHQLGNVLGERSLVELTQAGFLIASSGAFALLAVRRADDRRFAVLASALFAVMLIREMDALLDVLLWHGAWKYLAAPLVIGALSWSLRDWRSVMAGGARMLSSRSGTVMLLGMAVLLCYSRMFGMSSNWHAVLGDAYVRTVKNAVEETTELLGYSFILAASINYLGQRLRAAAGVRHSARGAATERSAKTMAARRAL